MKSRRVALALAGLGLWAGFGRAQGPLVGGPELSPPAMRAEQVQPVTPAAQWQLPPGAPLAPPAGGGPGSTAYPPGTPIGGPYPPPAGAFPPVPTALQMNVHVPVTATHVPPPTQTGRFDHMPPQYPLVKSQFGNRPILNTLQRLGVGCWSHISSVGCSSLGSELTFIFGSCRAFYGEPCQHGPPPVPLPAGATAPPPLAPVHAVPAPAGPIDHVPY